MRRKALAAATLVAAAPVAAADAHVYAGCQKPPCKRHVIRPYKPFLASVGACESGTSGWLRHGLRAVSSTGQYRGRYQFGMPDWQRAGGRGDPATAGWLELAYWAVVWLGMNGRQSWPNC